MTDIDLYGDNDLTDDDIAGHAPLDPNDPSWMEYAARRLRRIHRLEVERAQLEQTYSNHINLLEARRDQQLATLDGRIKWLADPLEQFHAAVLKLDPKRKTIPLPFGRLTSRTPQKVKIVVKDEEAFVEWAKVNAPDLLKLTYKPDRPAIVDDGRFTHTALRPGDEPAPVVAESGEQVPGIQAVLSAITFDVVTDDVVGDDL